FGVILLAALTLLSMTGCSETAGNGGAQGTAAASAEKQADGIEVTTAEGFDTDYTPVMKAYFEAIEKQDFEAYKAVIYPPFYEKLEAYYQQQGKTMEDVFAGLHKQFDEDGYDNWRFTRMYLAYYANQQGVSSENDALDFLAAFQKNGIVDEAFVEDTKKAASDMQDVKFSVYALYSGDEEDVAVLSGKEILTLKTEAGTYLFG
ncbi:MAG: hypothetical protein J6S92_04865, partial [Oscillospiraceae bacterium]|nr:hypothetical protein [Oscillospiraceae bacterium]